MLDYTFPLTSEESAFAEKHHDVLLRYLHFHKLPVDEFYDIAVFGYLRAVRKYLARPELRQYKFSTIARRAMSCDVRHSKEYWNRAKRKGDVCSFDEERYFGDLRDTVTESLENVIDFERLARKITPAQRRIASLRADGYEDREIACICGIACADVEAEMEKARCRILMFLPENTAMAA